MGKYDDIINLPHHVSDYHKPMPMASRAAQFAPFAALSGHDDAIAETIRLTESFKELSEDEKNIISRKLKYALKNKSLVDLTYFHPDKTKSGGFYERITGVVKKWDENENIIILRNEIKIKINHISDIIIRECKIDF